MRSPERPPAAPTTRGRAYLLGGLALAAFVVACALGLLLRGERDRVPLVVRGGPGSLEWSLAPGGAVSGDAAVLALTARTSVPLQAGADEDASAYVARMLAARGTTEAVLSIRSSTSMVSSDERWVARLDGVLVRAPGDRLDPLLLLTVRRRDREEVHPWLLRARVGGRPVLAADLAAHVGAEPGWRRLLGRRAGIELRLQPLTQEEEQALLTSNGAAGFTSPAPAGAPR